MRITGAHKTDENMFQGAAILSCLERAAILRAAIPHRCSETRIFILLDEPSHRIRWVDRAKLWRNATFIHFLRETHTSKFLNAHRFGSTHIFTLMDEFGVSIALKLWRQADFNPSNCPAHCTGCFSCDSMSCSDCVLQFSGCANVLVTLCFASPRWLPALY